MTFKGLYSRWGRQTCKQINEIKCYKTILEVHNGKKSLSPNSTCMTCDCVFSVIQLVYILTHSVGFPGGSDSKEFTCNMGDLGSEGPWVGKIPLEKGMATYSNILAWRIPWTEEPGGLLFTGSQRVGHDWATKHSTLLVNRSVCFLKKLSFFFLLALWFYVFIFGPTGAFSSCREQRMGASLAAQQGL